MELLPVEILQHIMCYLDNDKFNLSCTNSLFNDLLYTILPCDKNVIYNSFINACKNGCVKFIQHLVKKEKITIKDIRLNNNKALKQASLYGHLSVVKYLMEQGLMVEDILSENNYILKWSSFHGHLPLVKYLLKEYHLPINDQTLRWIGHNGHNIIIKYFTKKCF